MDSAFELFAFIARSENRFEVLRALAPTAVERSDIQSTTGIPRATLSRILADCRDRNLVERSGREYALTSLGREFVAELDVLLRSIDRLQALQALSELLPVDTLDVDLFTVEALSVTMPSRIDPMAPVSRAAELVGDSSLVRGFCYSLLHAPILSMTRDIVESGSRFDGVVSSAILDVVGSDPELVAPVTALMGTGRADVAVLDGRIETQFIITDQRVLFLVADRGGAIRGLVEATDPAIRRWAEARFASHKAAAEPLDPDALADRLAA